MAYRNILVSNPAKISVKNEQLVIETDNKYSVPIEDITSVILESRQINISAYDDAVFGLYKSLQRL